VAMFDFLDSLRAKGAKISTLALFHEDTIYGADSARAQNQLAKERGYKVAADIKYHSNASSLTAEAQELKSVNADVLMPSSYTTDAILLVKTMAELGYTPNAIVAQAAGFVDPTLYQAVGKDLNASITRASFTLDLGTKRPSILAVNKLYRARSGIDLNDNTSREFTGLIVAAEAINRAKSIDGSKIRDALAASDIPGDQTIMPWRRIKYDATGQNPFADPVLLQYVNGTFKTIFPDPLAVAKPVWPRSA
jgi:branched-chain amino acid transport system substrate-binding protein